MSSESSPLRAGESAELLRLLGGVAEAGRALPEGFRALAEETSDRSSRALLERLAEAVERGETLASALKAEGGHCPRHMIGIVAAAARSGQPARVLSEAGRFARLRSDVYRQLFIQLFYPIILCCAYLALFLLLSFWIVPMYENLFREFGVDLPQLTIALIEFSRVLRNPGFWGVLALILLGCFVVAVMEQWRTYRITTRLSQGVPLFGALWRNATMAEFVHLLALLLEGHVPLPEALRLAASGTRDRPLVLASEGVARRIENGDPFGDAATAYRLFPRGLTKLLDWAERKESLPEALRLGGELYLARARAQTTLLGVFLFVSGIILVLLGTWLTIVALYLPLVKLMSELSG